MAMMMFLELSSADNHFPSSRVSKPEPKVCYTSHAPDAFNSLGSGALGWGIWWAGLRNSQGLLHPP